MEVNCEGCAGCCVDWRAIAPPDLDLDHERRGQYRPIDDTYNLVVLTRDDVRAFLDAGLADALTPRLFHADDGVEIDGVELAAIEGKPVFFVGLRKPPKPVGPFGAAATWLPACAFLDPGTLQCRIHDTELYPTDCTEYPGHNLALDAETECERVERGFGGARLLDDDPPDSLAGLMLGPQAVGQKVFLYPEPAALEGVVRRVAAGDLDRETHAEFVATAAASAPGTTEIDPAHYEQAVERARTADSWAGRVVEEWTARAGECLDPEQAADAEEAWGAPPTPGWE